MNKEVIHKKLVLKNVLCNNIKNKRKKSNDYPKPTPPTRQ